MERVLGRYEPYVYAIVRIVVGLLFAMHGSQKLLGWPANPAGGGGGGGGLPPMILAAGVIELVCGLMIALGLFAGIAAFVACGEMAVAYFMAHFPRHPLPIVNQGEPAVLYCFIFLYIAARGSNGWSLDQALFRRGRG